MSSFFFSSCAYGLSSAFGTASSLARSHCTLLFSSDFAAFGRKNMLMSSKIFFVSISEFSNADIFSTFFFLSVTTAYSLTFSFGAAYSARLFFSSG